MNTSPNIQRISGHVALGTALTLVAGLACSIGALYLHGAARSALSTIGKAAMIVGGGGLGISLPIYVLRKAPGDPGIYKRLIIAALIGVIAGITLLKVNISHPASKMVGQSLTTTSSSILMTLVFYWIIYGKEQEKTDRGQPLARPMSQPVRASTPSSKQQGQSVMDLKVLRKKRDGLLRQAEEKLAASKEGGS